MHVATVQPLDSMDSQALTDGFEMRRGAIDSGTSLITDIKVATLVAMSLHQNNGPGEKSGKADVAMDCDTAGYETSM